MLVAFLGLLICLARLSSSEDVKTCPSKGPHGPVRGPCCSKPTNPSPCHSNKFTNCDSLVSDDCYHAYMETESSCTYNCRWEGTRCVQNACCTLNHDFAITGLTYKHQQILVNNHYLQWDRTTRRFSLTTNGRDYNTLFSVTRTQDMFEARHVLTNLLINYNGADGQELSGVGESSPATQWHVQDTDYVVWNSWFNNYWYITADGRLGCLENSPWNARVAILDAPPLFCAFQGNSLLDKVYLEKDRSFYPSWGDIRNLGLQDILEVIRPHCPFPIDDTVLIGVMTQNDNNNDYGMRWENRLRVDVLDIGDRNLTSADCTLLRGNGGSHPQKFSQIEEKSTESYQEWSVGVNLKIKSEFTVPIKLVSVKWGLELEVDFQITHYDKKSAKTTTTEEYDLYPGEGLFKFVNPTLAVTYGFNLQGEVLLWKSNSEYFIFTFKDTRASGNIVWALQPSTSYLVTQLSDPCRL